MIKLYDNNYIMILIEDSQMLYRHEAEYKKELKSLGIKNGTIIFDTILYSGNTNNRFLTAKIKDGKIQRTTYRYVSASIEWDHPIRKMTCDFLRAHKESLKNSNLLEEQKEQILSGKNI